MRKLLDVNSHSLFPAKVYFLIKWTDKSIGYKQTAILKLLRALENAAMLTTAPQSSRIITWLLSRMVTSRCRPLCCGEAGEKEKESARYRAYPANSGYIARVFYFFDNHNYNKIVKSDWLSTALISALIGQFNRTLRVMPK